MGPGSVTSVSPPVAASTAANGESADLRKAAKGFEEMFLVFLLRAGREGGVGDAVAGSEAVRSTQGMLDAQLARSGAQQSRLGIADAVVRQFSHPMKRG